MSEVFKKILIANRGEVAVNIIKVCQNLNIQTVAIFSEADKDSLHVQLADESYCIGPVDAKRSYLHGVNIVGLALAAKVEAIHPGYGFLSENAEFARLCTENNITFIGPASSVLETMSNKIVAKEVMRGLGMPVIEGYDVLAQLDCLKKTAKKIGYPVILKSKQGGGGRGIRVAKREEELEQGMAEVLQESKQYFNNEQLYMEKYIEHASHIEVQVVADSHGNIVILGTRDCSIQQSNQKLIEEAPDIKLCDTERNHLFELCKKATKISGYTNCGTFEFLLDQEHNFYFMEMNCRLQVERCVTEAITSIDLIATQIKVAAGQQLPYEQENIKFHGHAIQCRINIDGDNMNEKTNLAITQLSLPQMEDVMFKTALEVGSHVPVFYDAMIGKLVVYGKDRLDALLKMEQALEKLEIKGVRTNIPLQKKVLNTLDFIQGIHNTDFINKYYTGVLSKRPNVYDRIREMVDSGTFKEFDKHLSMTNILNFTDYDEKLRKARDASQSEEGVVWGEAKVSTISCVLIVMDGNFMMGSMGVVVGEKITRAFEYATIKKLPVVVFTVSGGARMQEGVFSLMQMVKTAGAVHTHANEKLLYIAVITHPTLGGVSASFASLADIIIVEKTATFGFSGKRIVQEVVGKNLPVDFQSANFNLTHGMVDLVLSESEVKQAVINILKLHN